MNESASAQWRCLLIMPRNFYALASVIERGLQGLGYETTVANDEYPENLLGRIMSKLGIPLTHTITRQTLTRQYLSGRQYELIVVIKGRGLDERTASVLGQHAKRVVGYHFDSFRYDCGPARWLQCLPRVCTFDYRDAEVHGMPVVELFTSMPSNPVVEPLRYRVSAIMRNHSQRLAYLDHVLRALGDQDSFVYVFEANLFTFVANFFRNPRLYLKYRRFISRRPLPYDRYVDVIKSSEFTVDYAHPKQTGITIRCFEALSSGTKIITNNPYLMRSPHFNADNAIVFQLKTEARALQMRVKELAGHRPLLRRRTVEDFLIELIGREHVAPIHGQAF